MLTTLLVNSIAPQNSFDPTPIAAKLGYQTAGEPIPSGEYGRDFRFVRSSDGANLMISFQALSSQNEAYRQDRGPGASEPIGLAAYGTVTPSQMPIGSDFRISCSGIDGSIRAKTMGKFEFVDCCLLLPLRKSASGYAEKVFGNEIPENFKEEIEFAVRSVLASIVARRFTEADTTIIGSQSCLTYMEIRSNKRVISVKEWAAGRGYAFRWNEDTNVIALTKGDLMVIVPLGSRKIKVGSQWRDTGEFIALKDGKAFVRLDAVEPG
ncbi:MAG: hypothetical protein ABL949_14135 [Fimbriimonadaceae bacterium]